ncbi:MAG: 7-carboxy-7-deazaguanine synthase QueE [Spirosomataceae bacterium]
MIQEKQNKSFVEAQNLAPLPVMEAFYTLQGEGYHSGKAAYFIRLGGCDVGCVWCDVKESWDATPHPAVPLEKIVETALENPARMAVITGGEPLMYDLTALTQLLKQKSFQTNIETSGVYPISGQWDWVCFSPKKFKAPHESIYRVANELKVIIYHPSDFDFAEQHAALVNQDCVLLLQPEWSRIQEMMPRIVEYVKRYPKWRVSLQTHKYMQIP